MSDIAELTVCRCEEVTVREIRKAVQDGCQTLQEVKMATRAGMGPCQGRVCRTLLERLVADETHRPVTGTALTIRVPVYPTHLGQLVEEV